MSIDRVSVKIPSSPERSYTIWIGREILKRIPEFINLQHYSNVIIAADSNAAELWLDTLNAALGTSRIVLLKSGEQYKSVAELESLWQKFFSLGANRHSLIVILGGGVAGDLAGFAASTYMRGIDFIQVPTTLLAQVDSSVGGKVAVDAIGIKNLVGSFRQPIAVVIDPDTLKTLPQRQLSSGFAEVLKHGLIADEGYFSTVAAMSFDALPSTDWSYIIKRSCEIKSGIVIQDEMENGSRKKLNFGHTVGHALESSLLTTSTPLLHGEAVAIGMVAEGFLSQKACGLAPAALCAIEDALTRFKLPTRLPVTVSERDIFCLMERDKKNVGTDPAWSLLPRIGECLWDVKLDRELIGLALRYINPEN